MELTPAQLALDPCTAGCVVTDVRTGEIRALVSYPSYDNNRMSGSVDAAYFAKLQSDMSNPLYNNATQAIKAPGSTFKPITAIAALEEGVISLTDTIDCTGVYDQANPPINCWIFPGRHGTEDIITGIQNSCNVVFAELGHRLSMTADGTYSPEKGAFYDSQICQYVWLGPHFRCRASRNRASSYHRGPGTFCYGPGN